MLVGRESEQELLYQAFQAQKISDFKNVTKTKSSLHLTVVTTYGLEQNKYAGHVQSVVTADDLFQPI